MNLPEDESGFLRSENSMIKIRTDPKHPNHSHQFNGAMFLT